MVFGGPPITLFSPITSECKFETLQPVRLVGTVAIKLVKEQFSDRFEREARAISMLNHPHICTLYDVGPHLSRDGAHRGRAVERPGAG